MPKQSYTRGKVAKTFTPIAIIFFILFLSTCSAYDSDRGSQELGLYEENKDKTIGELASFSADKAMKIGVSYAKSIGVAEEVQKDFYLCMGDFVRTKSASLKLEEIMGWCKSKYDSDFESFQKEARLYDYYAIKEQFSAWDGSHRQSIEAIKKVMNDPDSFDHDETRYRINLKDENPHMIVITSFRGNNAFGGKVLQRMQTKVDLWTGNVLDMEMTE